MTLRIIIECCYALSIMLSVSYKPYILSVVMPNVVMPNVVMLSVVMLSVFAPLWHRL
jgi:hypothetical protein